MRHASPENVQFASELKTNFCRTSTRGLQMLRRGVSCRTKRLALD
jgi:hypothetical protein